MIILAVERQCVVFAVTQLLVEVVKRRRRESIVMNVARACGSFRDGKDRQTLRRRCQRDGQ